MHATASATALAVRNVLVATDFSPCSQRALLHAVTVAHRLGSTLHLVHVVQPAVFCLVPPEGYAGSVEAANHAVDLARADAETLIGNVLRRTHCEDLKHHVWVQLGAASAALHAIIQREHIDLVVVGTHGRTGLRKLVLGSVAEEIFRQAPCPVLTVGPHCWQSDPQTIRLKHILFPTNLSVDAARALPFAIAIAAEFNAALTILNVIETVGTEEPHDRPRIVAALQERMREMVCTTAPMPPQTDFQVEFGDIVECVIETVAHLEATLIVSGLKPPGSYADSLPWVHAYKVVCNVGCPVLTLRDPRYHSHHPAGSLVTKKSDELG
jgi:nucleotide-binding universal stress UspA family protein